MKTAFTLDLPVELAKCFLFLERCQKIKKITNFLSFFFFIGKIRPFKVLQCYQPLTFPHGVRALYLQLGTLFRCWQCGRTAATSRSAEERSVGKTLGVSETLRDHGSSSFLMFFVVGIKQGSNICGNVDGFHLNGVMVCICLG